jgi:1-phosphofructokinase family hexose kinase
MILTISPNPAVDRILLVDEIVPATTMRASGMIDHIGGKGLDTSIALHCMGVDTLGLGFAAGANGRIMAGALDALGVPNELIWLEGETRIAHVIVETNRHRHSHIIAGALPTSPAQGDALLERMRHHLPQAKWVVGGGSLPPGLPTTYAAQIQAIAKEAGVPTLFDMTGRPVHELLAGPGGAPTILKMNEDEFAQTFGFAHFKTSGSGLEALAQAAANIVVQENLNTLVLTLGKDGILAITPDEVLHAQAPEQQVFNAAGAGDSASAGIVWRLSEGDAWENALTWAAAISAASVLTDRTAIVDPVEAEALLAHVRILRVL